MKDQLEVFEVRQNHNQIVYWTNFLHESRHICMATTCKGLCYVGSPIQTFDDLEKWVGTQLPNHYLVRDDSQLKPYTSQFEEYFQKQRVDFKLSIDLYGTQFQKTVWHVLNNIPFGQKLSYSDI